MGKHSSIHDFNRNQMTNLVFILLSVFIFTLTNCYWHNNWDGRLSFVCPRKNNIYGAIKRMESYHDNRKEDRRWHFECSYEVQKAGHCAWTGWLNDWDDELHYKCPLSGYIAGFYSYHDNRKEDRRWRWFCCTTVQGLEDCKWTNNINAWDGPMNYNVPSTRVINGLYSYHSNRKEDRQWKAYECRLKNCEITNIKITGKPQAYFKGVKVIGVKTGLNCGSLPKTLSMEHTVQYQRDVSISKMDSFEFGFSSEVSVEVGIEGFGSVTSTVGYSSTLGYSMTNTETVSNSVSTSNGNSISVPACSAVLAMAVAKEYEYIGQRVSAEYTINCNGKSQKKYGKVNILGHTFLNVDSATLEEIKVEKNKCGAGQFRCITSIDTSSIITSGSAVESRFKACFASKGRALNQTTEDTFEEYDVDSQEMELWDQQISEREGDEVED